MTIAAEASAPGLLAAGFEDGVGQSQQVFRAAMTALARPGLVQRLETVLTPPAPLASAAAALVLALCDFETTVHLDAPLAGNPEVERFLRFHTGARFVRHPAEAQFAVIAAPNDMSSLGDFALGTLDYPDRSTTLILQVETLDGPPLATMTGPGIKGSVALRIGGLGGDFLGQAKANRTLFPRGVDMLIVSGDRLIGLPRSTRLEELR